MKLCAANAGCTGGQFRLFSGLIYLNDTARRDNNVAINFTLAHDFGVQRLPLRGEAVSFAD